MPKRLPLAALLALFAFALAGCGDSNGSTPEPDPARDSQAAGEPGERLPSRTGLARWRLSEKETYDVFRQSSDYVYDPLTYWRRRSGFDFMQTFEAHPKGEYRVRTNSQGMRENDEPRAVKPALRVLVVGDSHTDCVCANEESYANQLEAVLAGADPGRSVEVLNCGCGSYSFYHYLGVLEKYADLAPDVFVIGVFAGNDFGEVLAPWHHFHGSERPRSPELRMRLQKALDVPIPGGGNTGAVSQGYNQYFYFDRLPDQLPVALTAATSVMEEIISACRERSIRLVVLYIPPPAEVDYESSRELFETVTRAYGGKPELLNAVSELGDKFLGFLRERDVAVLDARPLFKAAPKPLYWPDDLHVNLKANRLLAEALAPLVSGK
ncbi:MAG: SGNH/GDSL hydrolase family protein [Planctomycetota bacterium]|nr:MAG: SGNH/GDSL hydrolase family protein [Planctomycetota bacterium]